MNLQSLSFSLRSIPTKAITIVTWKWANHFWNLSTQTLSWKMSMIMKRAMALPYNQQSCKICWETNLRTSIICLLTKQIKHWKSSKMERSKWIPYWRLDMSYHDNTSRSNMRQSWMPLPLTVIWKYVTATSNETKMTSTRSISTMPYSQMTIAKILSRIPGSRYEGKGPW